MAKYDYRWGDWAPSMALEDLKALNVSSPEEHEVLFSFNSDPDAYAFDWWWMTWGRDLFQNWIKDEVGRVEDPSE